jgi:hypothetical protein
VALALGLTAAALVMWLLGANLAAIATAVVVFVIIMILTFRRGGWGEHWYGTGG